MKNKFITNIKLLNLLILPFLMSGCEDDPTKFGNDPIPPAGPDIVIEAPLSPDDPIFKALYPDTTIAHYPPTADLIVRTNGYETTPAGSFSMGFNGSPHFEKPTHLVALAGFHTMRYEVTVEQYRTFVEANPGKVSMPPEPFWGWDVVTMPDGSVQDRSKFPIVNVTWKEAKAYAEWVGGRLPTEAEWEFMAGNFWRDRKIFGPGGTMTNGTWSYVNSNQFVKSITQNGQQIDRYGHIPHPVGEYKVFHSSGRPSHTIFTTIGTEKELFEPRLLITALTGITDTDTSVDWAKGIADGCGNVLEWCSDWFGDDYYQDCADGNTSDIYWTEAADGSRLSGGQTIVFCPAGPSKGSHKVVRGGSYYMAEIGIRRYSRQRMYQGVRNEQLGFRVVWDEEVLPVPAYPWMEE